MTSYNMKDLLSAIFILILAVTLSTIISCCTFLNYNQNYLKAVPFKDKVKLLSSIPDEQTELDKNTECSKTDQTVPIYIDYFLGDEGFLETYHHNLDDHHIEALYQDAENSLHIIFKNIPDNALDMDDEVTAAMICRVVNCVKEVAEFRAELLISTGRSYLVNNVSCPVSDSGS